MAEPERVGEGGHLGDVAQWRRARVGLDGDAGGAETVDGGSETIPVADLPAEVGEPLGVGRMDHDAGVPVIDPQPHGAVGAGCRELGAEHLGPERAPGVGFR